MMTRMHPIVGLLMCVALGCGSSGEDGELQEEMSGQLAAPDLDVSAEDGELADVEEIDLGALEQEIVAGTAVRRVRIPASGSARLSTLPGTSTNNEPNSNFMAFTGLRGSAPPYFGQFANLKVNGAGQDIYYCGGFTCTGGGKGQIPHNRLAAPTSTDSTVAARELRTNTKLCLGGDQFILEVLVATREIPGIQCQALRTALPSL